MKKSLLIFILIIAGALFLATALSLLTQRLRLTILSTNLSSQTVSFFQPVELTFNRPLTAVFIQNCRVTSIPSHEFGLQAQDVKLLVTPLRSYEELTTYQITLDCQGVNYRTSFQTGSFTTASATDTALLQSELDFETASSIEALFAAQPWREKLPIKSEQFTIVYDQVDDVYLVELFISPEDNATPAQIESQVRQELQKIGAPDLPIEYR